MDFKRVQELIRFFESSSLMTLHVEEGDFKLSLSKLTTTTPPAESKPVITNPDLALQNPATKDKAMLDPDEAFLRPIKSPLVGTYYASASPSGEPFVEIGKFVNKGDTVCIIEAMKIMNEIAAPFSGVIEKIAVQSGQVIGFDQVLMVVRPKE